MVASIPWPNLVTIVRMGLIFVSVILIYSPNTIGRLIGAMLAVLIIVGDWLDGFLARKLDQTSTLGSVLDIVADRILECVMWIVLADLKLIPVWIPVVVISRGILTDSIRSYALSLGYSGFGDKSMMKSKLGQFLTGSPLMRTPYAVLKAFCFGWLLLVSALGQYLRQIYFSSTSWYEIGLDIGLWAAVVSTVICIARGLPVLIEGVAMIRQDEARE